VLKDTDGWRRRDIYYGGVGGAHTTIDMDSLLRTRGFFITLIDIALDDPGLQCLPRGGL
jgi:hypothetical protein